MSTQLTLRISDDLLEQAKEQAKESRAEVLRRWVEMGARAEDAVRDLQGQVDDLRKVIEEQQALIERQAEQRAQEAQEAKVRDDALAGQVTEALRGLHAVYRTAQATQRETTGLWTGLGGQLLARRKRDSDEGQDEAKALADRLRELAGLA